MQILRNVYKQIVSEAHRQAPLECCGYLAGQGTIISRALQMKNMDKSSIHYSFDPAEQFAAIKQIRRENLLVLAVYHSHPETPARPSQEDIRLALDPNISHVIISLCDEQEDVRSFKIVKGHVEQEELVIK